MYRCTSVGLHRIGIHYWRSACACSTARLPTEGAMVISLSQFEISTGLQIRLLKGSILSHSAEASDPTIKPIAFATAVC